MTNSSEYAMRRKKQYAQMTALQKALSHIVPVYRGPHQPKMQRLQRKLQMTQSVLLRDMKAAAKQKKLTPEQQRRWVKEYSRRVNSVVEEMRNTIRKGKMDSSREARRKRREKRSENK